MRKKILKSKIINSAFLLSFLFVVGGMLWTYFALRGIASPLILHFNNLLGINQIGNLSDLLRFGGTGLVFVLVNFFLALELEDRDAFLGKLLATATLFMSVIIFVGFAAIISVN